MDTQQSIYHFNSHELRTVVKSGEPWFMAKDVCSILDLSNPNHIVLTLDSNEKEKLKFVPTKNVDTKRGGLKCPAWFISESGVYQCLMRSNKPQAKNFQRWLRKEVLPQIRKTGEYKSRIPVKPDEATEQQKAIIKQLLHEIGILDDCFPDMLAYKLLLKDFFCDLIKHLKNLESFVDAKSKGNPAVMLLNEKILNELNHKRFLKHANNQSS